MKRKSRVNLAWGRELAYAVGLIASDGNLSKDKRHINLTSKDLENINNFKSCLCLNNKIGMKGRGGNKFKKYYVIQFGDVNFYEFPNSIGLTEAKSKSIKKVMVPTKYFRDFLRGCIDGDGNISVTSHPESQYSQLRLRLASASKPFLVWMKGQINKLVTIEGGWISDEKLKSTFTLSFGKSDSFKILKFMYYSGVKHFLRRKYLIWKKCASGEIG